MWLSGAASSTDFTRTGHDHDARYYTQTQSDARYLPVGGKAADADKLDGKDADDFLQGQGSIGAGFSAMAQDDPAERHLIEGFGALDLFCFTTAAGEPDARFALNSFDGPLAQFFAERTDGGISVAANRNSISFGGPLGLTPGT